MTSLKSVCMHLFCCTLTIFSFINYSLHLFAIFALSISFPSCPSLSISQRVYRVHTWSIGGHICRERGIYARIPVASARIRQEARGREGRVFHRDLPVVCLTERGRWREGGAHGKREREKRGCGCVCVWVGCCEEGRWR
jgi:hypothetical protein